MAYNVDKNDKLEIVLSKNFKLKEFVVSAGYPQFTDINLTFALSHLDSLRLLANHLQIVRDFFSIPIAITSGVRCPELNAAVGGVPTSQHAKAEAADIVLPSAMFDTVFHWIGKESKLPFGQIIDEVNKSGHRWLHYSLGVPYRDASLCGQILIQRNGKYTSLV